MHSEDATMILGLPRLSSARLERVAHSRDIVGPIDLADPLGADSLDGLNDGVVRFPPLVDGARRQDVLTPVAEV